MLSRVKRTVLGGIAIAALTVLVAPASAFAADTPGTADVTAGDLTYSAPESVGFSATLGGTDQVASADQAIEVLDNTGSAAGWSISLTTTTFTTGEGGFSLAQGSVTDASEPVGLCVGTCTLGDNSALSENYPVAIPDDVTAPAAAVIQDAAPGTGLSPQTWTHTMHLAIPANAHAGSYSSTWTYTLGSAVA